MKDKFRRAQINASQQPDQPRLTFFMWISIRASFAAASSSNQPTRIFPGWPIQPYSQKGTSR
jgi:hypothetical protein